MKVVSSEALTKLIQLSKDEFLSKSNTTTVTTSGLKTINGESILGTGDIDTSELPDQTGQSGKFLTTNGTAVSWADATTDSEVEWATYGTTTYQQVKDWYDAGKVVAVKRNDIVYILYAINSVNNRIWFASVSGINGVLSWVSLTTSDEWSNGSYSIQQRIPAGTSGNIVTYTGTTGTVGSATINDIVPSQSGQSGKFLTTNGSSVSWTTVDSLPDQTGQSGKVLTTNGTTVSWENASGSTITYWEDD